MERTALEADILARAVAEVEAVNEVLRRAVSG